MSGWFSIDILASVPINLIMKIIFSNSKNVNLSGQRMIRIARLPRLYRLIRMARFVKILKVFKQSAFYLKVQMIFRLNNAALRLTIFFMTVILCVHLAGCLWIMMASLNDFNP